MALELKARSLNRLIDTTETSPMHIKVQKVNGRSAKSGLSVEEMKIMI